MFFKQVMRNAARSRKSNSLFYGSLVVAIVAFYTLLSLDKQDVMVFLSSIESDAVGKLLTLIPVVYVLSLFFVFFLVYFAYKYQTDSRKKEFGLYLMMGMKRSKMFALLMCETLWSSLISAAIGLPVALLLTEVTSLAGAKLVGMGIIGHQFSLSLDAVLWTVVGFVAVQLLSMLIICLRYSRTEPAQFLQPSAAEKQKKVSRTGGAVCFSIGVLFLIAAYAVGILYLKVMDWRTPLTFVLGIVGTFLLCRGLGSFVGRRIEKQEPKKSGLFTFTGRQIQENALHQHKNLAVSSLLIVIALSCISVGVGNAAGRSSAEDRSVDFSVMGTEAEVMTVLNQPEIRELTDVVYPLWLGRADYEYKDYDISGLVSAMKKVPQTDLRDNMIENLEQRFDYILSESGYNEFLSSQGKKPINLSGDKVGVYSSMGAGDSGSFLSTMDQALGYGASIKIGGKDYELLPELYYDNVVADRAITLYVAYILPDTLYDELAMDNEPYCWNVRLDKELVEDVGLMQAIEKMDEKLAASGLEYDSFLGGIGRSLFYTVAASYLTLYLGVLFLIIANTVIGMKYLIEQQENRRRYTTLLMLGTGKDELCTSVKKQIGTFFALVLGVAVCSSVFAVLAIFNGYTTLTYGASVIKVVLFAAVAFALFCLLEFVYIGLVKRAGCREIRSLKVTDRG